MKKQITASVKNGSVVVEMPVDLLVFACEQNPECRCKVKNRSAFGEYVAKHIVEHDEDEAGNTALYRLLDSLFVAAIEDAEGDIVSLLHGEG